jgi:predicted regulator of Ras-like GTPase activity (Roadblock/LC7/MglB family)
MVKKKEIDGNMTVGEEIVISTESTPEEAVNEDDPEYESLFSSVQEIRKNQDVVGYILRGESKAAVDLNESSKIIEYAMMSSQALESSEVMAESFDLGKIENIVIEGKDIKVLCLNLGQNKLSFFMNKTAPHNWLLERLQPKNDTPT